MQKKAKATLQIFIIWYQKLEQYVECYQKEKNELKINIIYMCDFGIDISITHACILMEELYFEF